MNVQVNPDKWERADRAFDDGQRAYIEFGAALVELNAKGVTHEEIAARYDISRASVTKAIAVGGDQRIVRNANNLPRSQESLYLLTSMPEKDFEKLAKPETTRADILALKAPKSPGKASPEAPKRDLMAELREDRDSQRTRAQRAEMENQQLKKEIAALKAEIAARYDLSQIEKLQLKKEIAELTSRLTEAENLLGPSVMTMLKPEPAKALKPAKKPEPIKAVKPAKKTEPPPATSRNDKLLELYARAKTHWANLDPEYVVSDFPEWIKEIFLSPTYLPADLRDLQSFKEKSPENKIAYFTDATFSAICDKHAARYAL